MGDDKDSTFQTNYFDDNKIILQNEFRKITKDWSLISDFGLTRGYKSSPTEEKNINHIF